MNKAKYYVVWKGIKPGIYTSWEMCKQQINGFNGARYKAFGTLEEAEAAYSGQLQKPSTTNKNKANSILFSNTSYIKESICADAACSGNPGPVEYRIVETATGKEIYRSPIYNNGTVNIGEFLAIVHALAMLKKTGSKLPIYSDSQTAIKWVRDKRIKTKLIKDSSNEKLFEVTERAIQWLQTNEWKNPLFKWDTKHWGEIPADFGRK